MSLHVVVGAGAAGLACAAALGKAGLRVMVLEARERIGGRIHTLELPGVESTVELGAEFVHGQPPEITTRIAGNEIVMAEGHDWCAEDGKIFRCDFFEQVMDVLGRMEQHAEPDISFLDFLDRLPPETLGERLHSRVLEYVSGFNAADPAKISVQSLVADQKAQDAIGGDEAYRLRHGYQSLITALEHECIAAGVEFRLGHVVERIEWKPGWVRARGRQHRNGFALDAASITVSVPVTVLRGRSPAAGITFDPPLPPEKVAALDMVEMGNVVRLALVFRERFWAKLRADDGAPLKSLRFLFSHAESFPTFWTQYPSEAPVLVAWASAARADRLGGNTKEQLIDKSLFDLSANLRLERGHLDELLVDAHAYDWRTDEFAAGSYSYLRVGGANAPRVLAQPLENTLFFAGEATEFSGNHGMVHGALTSGERAAREVRQVHTINGSHPRAA